MKAKWVETDTGVWHLKREDGLLGAVTFESIGDYTIAVLRDYVSLESAKLAVERAVGAETKEGE